MAWWRFVCRNQSSRSTRRLSPSGCEKTNSDKPFAGRGIICSARTSPRKIPACCGNTTFSSPRSKRSEEHTSELQSLTNLVCRLLLEKKKKKKKKQKKKKNKN